MGGDLSAWPATGGRREGASAAKDILRKEYKEGMTMEDGIKLGAKAIKRILGKEFDAKRLDGAYIDLATAEYKVIDKKKFKV